MGGFSVRSVYRHETGEALYAEQVVLFAADDADEAIAKAEVEAAPYVEGLTAEVVPLFKSFEMIDDPLDGGKIFSLMRGSRLEPEQYSDRCFDTGHEKQRCT